MNKKTPDRIHKPKIEMNLDAYPKQREFIDDDALESAFIGGVGSGKALSIHTPIPTPLGWTTMAELKIGDALFDDLGKICHVVFTTDIMLGHKCYKITFSDGSYIIADAEHLWETYDYLTRKNMVRTINTASEPKIRTTEEIKNSLKHRNKESNHSVKNIRWLKGIEKDLPIDPYVLGVWLGDGSSAEARFTLTEDIIIDQIKKADYSINQIKAKKPIEYKVGSQPEKRDSSTGKMMSNGSLTSILREQELLNNKHIPIPYLRASKEQRLRLLQGLMDTDGSIGETGSCEFSVCCKQLAEDTAELIRTLGMNVRVKESDAKLYGKVVNRRYRLNFNPLLDVFTLPYKLERIKKNHREWCNHRYIISVVECPSEPVRCIQVDSSRHMYLAGDFIPTHNTTAGAMKALLICSKFKGIWGIVTAPQIRLLRAATIPTYDRIFPPEMVVKRRESPHAEWDLIHGNKIMFWSTEKPQTIAGLEIGWAHMDEASLSPYESYINIKKRLRQRDASGKSFPYQIFMTTTPRQLNWLYQEISRIDSPISVSVASTKDNIFLENRETYIAAMGLTGKAYEQEIEGKFVYLAGECLFTQETLQMILSNDICPPIRYEEDSYMAIWKEPVVGGHYAAGADCADEGGGGSNVLVIMDAQTGEEVAELAADIPADEFAIRAYRALKKYNFPLFAPERNGTAGGIVVQKLLDLGYPNMYYDRNQKPGWTTNPRSVWPKIGKFEMLMMYEEAVRKRQTIVHSSEAVGEMSTMVRQENLKGDTFNPRPGCRSDRVMARAICWQVKEAALMGKGNKFMAVARRSIV